MNRTSVALIVASSLAWSPARAGDAPQTYSDQQVATAIAEGLRQSPGATIDQIQAIARTQYHISDEQFGNARQLLVNGQTAPAFSTEQVAQAMSQAQQDTPGATSEQLQARARDAYGVSAAQFQAAQRFLAGLRSTGLTAQERSRALADAARESGLRAQVRVYLANLDSAKLGEAERRQRIAADAHRLGISAADVAAIAGRGIEWNAANLRDMDQIADTGKSRWNAALAHGSYFNANGTINTSDPRIFDARGTRIATDLGVSYSEIRSAAARYRLDPALTPEEQARGLAGWAWAHSVMNQDLAAALGVGVSTVDDYVAQHRANREPLAPRRNANGTPMTEEQARDIRDDLVRRWNGPAAISVVGASGRRYMNRAAAPTALALTITTLSDADKADILAGTGRAF